MSSPALNRLKLQYRAWRYRLKLDRPEIRWLRRVLRPGDTAIDIGAHKGAYTYWMRQAVGTAGRVLAFEPQPRLVAYLRQVVADFGWENIDVEHMGLSSRSGELILNVPGDDVSPGASLVSAKAQAGGQRIPVRVDTLDHHLRINRIDRGVRFIKCDVEGHELEVFEGARQTLQAQAPVLLFECEARHNPERPMAMVFSFLQQLGYRGYFFWRGRLQTVADFEPEVHQEFGAKHYANNFLFVPDGFDVPLD
jgi:FkbM family methyltransferase